MYITGGKRSVSDTVVFSRSSDISHKWETPASKAISSQHRSSEYPWTLGQSFQKKNLHQKEPHYLMKCQFTVWSTSGQKEPSMVRKPSEMLGLLFQRTPEPPHRGQRCGDLNISTMIECNISKTFKSVSSQFTFRGWWVSNSLLRWNG